MLWNHSTRKDIRADRTAPIADDERFLIPGSEDDDEPDRSRPVPWDWPESPHPASA
jgi:hypothetical protein